MTAEFPPYRIERTDALIPYANNARTHSDAQVAQIAASIRAFGFTNPILVDGERGIIAGHGRVLAARKLEMPEVPVVELAHLSPAQRKAYIIADNKLALNSGWDDDLLRIELGDLRDEEFDLELTGFSGDELDKFFSDGALNDASPPSDFKSFDENIETEHKCPSCGYTWSGKSA